jgi:hypothetical protein
MGTAITSLTKLPVFRSDVLPARQTNVQW